MSTKITSFDPPVAACLTPPAIGGIAVLQVIGRRAPELLTPLLKADKPIDLQRMESGRLRLCRLVDQDQIIDDVLVSVRRDTSGDSIIDISLHGGPRIVQRSLMLLKRVGVRIVEPLELLEKSWPKAGRVEQAVLAALVGTKTRLAVSWLVKMIDVLPAALSRIIADIETGNISAALASLRTLCGNAVKARYLIKGVRAVLVGGPNTGKSTLANALAERAQAVVSDSPGTTRDWVEHPAAVFGIPFTFVDTAGIRKSTDPIEQEAVRRTRQQIISSDLIIRVLDGSLGPAPAERWNLTSVRKAKRRNHAMRRHVFVWNKSDRPMHPEQAELLAVAGSSGLAVSALTGRGIADLRKKLAGMVGLAKGVDDHLVAPVNNEQLELCAKALSELSSDPPDAQAAIYSLELVLG